MNEISEKAKHLLFAYSLVCAEGTTRDEHDKVYYALQSYITELESARRLIPVSERLPELNQDVLGLVDGVIVEGSFYQDWEHGIYFSDGVSGMLVATHWMPRPELPVSEEAQE